MLSAGYFSRSGSLKVKSPILTKSSGGHVDGAVATRSGHDMVYRMGSRMSGHPSCTRPRVRVRVRVRHHLAAVCGLSVETLAYELTFLERVRAKVRVRP